MQQCNINDTRTWCNCLIQTMGYKSDIMTMSEAGGKNVQQHVLTLVSDLIKTPDLPKPANASNI